jgi:hypothetical protein
MFLPCRPAHFGLWIAALVLTGCATLPDVPGPRVDLPEGSEFPEFLPLEDVIFERTEATQRDAEAEAELEARVTALRARAARLRAQQIE